MKAIYTLSIYCRDMELGKTKAAITNNKILVNSTNGIPELLASVAPLEINPV